MRCVSRIHRNSRNDRIRNECIKGSLGVMVIVVEMRENRWRWFRHIERRSNDDIVEKIGELRAEGNRGKDRTWTKWMEVIRGNMRPYG